MVELLVTVLLAGIIFLAMTPMFVSVLKGTSTNSRRVIATNIAQAQLEKIRTLAASPSSYANITNSNLNSSSWNPSLITTTYTPPAGGQPYNISTTVSTDASTAPYKTVTVSVSRPNDGFTTSVSTVIQNPNPITTSSTSGPTGGNGPFSLTVAFKNYTEVSSAGVYVVYVNTVPTPNVTTTAAPLKQIPSSSATTCTWTNLPGGMNYMYTVYCNSVDWSGALYTPNFHMLSNGWVKFDTDPGGS
jgi:Tfp pilus assembly protein PilV